MPARDQVLRDLQKLPNVGPSIAVDLWDLGIRRAEDLVGCDPEEMYVRLCDQRGTHIDRCMLYVLRAVVYIASSDPPEPGRTMWWTWKDEQPPAPRRRAAQRRASSR